MSDLDNDLSLTQDELTALKARADMLGVPYHPSIGLEKLRDKVNAAVTATVPIPVSPVVATDKAVSVSSPVESENALRLRRRREANELLRIRVTCMNPAKKEWDGEIFTAGNTAVGTVKKYVPFNADDGWHVPRIIYNMMRDRMCQTFVNAKSKNGVTIRQGKMIKEFAIEILPPLTTAELAELAQRQAMSRAID